MDNLRLYVTGPTDEFIGKDRGVTMEAREKYDVSARLQALRMLTVQLKERWVRNSDAATFPREFTTLIDEMSDILFWPNLSDRVLRTPPSFLEQFDAALDSLTQSLSLAGYQRPNEKLLAKIIYGISELAPLVDFLARRTHNDNDEVSDLQVLSNSLQRTLQKIDSRYIHNPDESRLIDNDSGVQREERDLLRAKLDTSETKRRIAEEKATQARRQTENLSQRVGQLISVVDELERKVAEDAETRSNFEKLIHSAHHTVEELERIKKVAESLASEAADDVMSGNYGQLAIDHEKSEFKFRTAALLLFGFSALGAALIAWNIGWFGYSQSDGSVWLNLTKKISVSLGIAGIGLYCSRLAAHHRRLAVWSKSLGVQLKTLESYLAGISDDRLKDGIREQFAKLTFSGPPDLLSPSKGNGDERVISAIAGALADSLHKK